MKLHLAMTLAERVQRELQPFCIRCEIAGSIRRGRPEVGDIDFVILPRRRGLGMRFDGLKIVANKNAA
jgi:DNA polymerase/3'-5' exonuclease PolX